MKISLYGTRGSIPAPSRRNRPTHEFGGNTTCLLVEGASGRHFVVDGGSGIRLYGEDLLKANKAMFSPDKPLVALLTHVHWDHIQGIPFFTPIYFPKNSIVFYGNCNYVSSLNEALQNSEPKKITQFALEKQQGKFVFPVRFSDLQSNVTFGDNEDLREGLEIDGLTIRTRGVNHPEGCYSYMFLENGKKFVDLTDHELLACLAPLEEDLLHLAPLSSIEERQGRISP